MSKKDLLERITRAPSDALRSTRREEDGARPAAPNAVTTRVSRKVVRRRSQTEQPEKVVARRRKVALDAQAGDPHPAVDLEQEPFVDDAEGAADLDELVEAAGEGSDAGEQPSATAATPPPAPEVVVERAPQVHARASASTGDAAPAQTRGGAPRAATPVEAAEPEPVRAREATPEPAPEPLPAVPEPFYEDPEDDAPGSYPAEADDEPEVPERPVQRFPGLGSAVVMPPPGWDPTNPMGYRRDQQAQVAGRGAAGDAPGRGRRRVETTAATPAAPGGAREEFRRRRPTPTTGRRGRGFERQRGKRRKGVGVKAPSPAPKAQKRRVKVDNVISVGQLAKQLGVKASVVIRSLMDMGQMSSITEMLDVETATLVAAEFDYEVDNVGFQEENYLQQDDEVDDEEGLQRRPPVVTIMGHVDHGKTTLLDAIRKSRVAQGEAGGITQHIGAYQVEHDERLITFIDTPGHEAFTAMRARGADVTDIVILVVAADDGVQPQTEEAISHAKAADVPIVVAVNKMDKPGVKAETVMQRLSEFGLVPEAWGGDTMYVPVSALRGDGLPELLEAVLLQAEVLDLVANPDRPAEGQVIEAKMERGRGAVASVLIESGTLNHGDYVVLGSAYGRVRALVDHRGKQIKKAGPSTPVELFGLSELPEVGDTMNVVKNERNAKKLADHRGLAKRQAALSKDRRQTAEDLFAAAQAQAKETLHIVLKADVQGTLQALIGALEQIAVEGAEVRVLHSAVGDISESDINLAAANGATLIGFNVNVDAKARQAAQQQGIEPEIYKVIYAVIDRVERELRGLLAPVYALSRVGSAEVRVLFKISRIGTVAGSFVVDGKIVRGSHAKVMRDGKVVYEGKVSGVKRFKDDVREVTAGYECGISLDGFHEELQQGDVIECFVEELVERS